MKTIVLIDDDPIANMINKRIIEKNFQCRVTAFTDAICALDQLNTWSASGSAEFPAVIFLDINMPRMDGWGFLEEYQKLPDTLLDNCAVFLLTSSRESDDMQRSKTYKRVRDLLSKPLTNDKLGILNQISS